MSITRRIGVVISTVALVLAAGAGTASARPSADSNFSFCNTTGGKIACFTAHLHFDNRYHFTLSNIVVTRHAVRQPQRARLCRGPERRMGPRKPWWSRIHLQELPGLQPQRILRYRTL